MFDAAPNTTCAQVDVCADAFVAHVVADAGRTEIWRIKNGERVEGAGVFLEVVAVRFDERRKNFGRDRYVRRGGETEGWREVDCQAVRRQDKSRVDPDRLALFQQDAVIVPFV